MLEVQSINSKSIIWTVEQSEFQQQEWNKHTSWWSINSKTIALPFPPEQPKLRTRHHQSLSPQQSKPLTLVKALCPTPGVTYPLNLHLNVVESTLFNVPPYMKKVISGPLGTLSFISVQPRLPVCSWIDAIFIIADHG